MTLMGILVILTSIFYLDPTNLEALSKIKIQH